MNLDIEGKFTVSLEGKIYGIGVESEINPFASYHHAVTSSGGNTESNSTEVTIDLGDDNVGDEFAVEMYSVMRYNTVIFKTIAGRSSCSHGENKILKLCYIIKVQMLFQFKI